MYEPPAMGVTRRERQQQQQQQPLCSSSSSSSASESPPRCRVGASPRYFYYFLVCLLLLVGCGRPANAQQLVKYDPDYDSIPAAAPSSSLSGGAKSSAVRAAAAVANELPGAWLGLGGSATQTTTTKPSFLAGLWGKGGSKEAQQQSNGGSSKFYDPSAELNTEKFGYRKKLSSRDKLKMQLREQENRMDGFHFDQSFDQEKEANVNRLGIVLSNKECRLSPSPVLSPEATYFVIECPSNVNKVTAQFLSGAPFKEAMTSNGLMLQKYLNFALSELGHISTEYILACVDPKQTDTCYPVQIDAKRVSSRLPTADRVIAGRGTALPQIDFNPKGTDFHITAFENEPLDLLVEANSLTFIDESTLVPERGFIDQAKHVVWRPRGSSPSKTIYLTDREHLGTNNLTVFTDLVPSMNPNLYDLRTTTGRLDPPFMPTHYSYYLRVSEHTQTVKLRLTAIDDVNTVCTVSGANPVDPEASRKPQMITGSGTTRSLQLGSLVDPATIVIECVNMNDPAAAAGGGDDSTSSALTVRYILQVVRQLGGSTLLRNLDVVGATLQQPFVPTVKGPYTVNMRNSGANDLSWVSFICLAQNKKAIVDVEGYPVDSVTGHSPYFRVGLGEVRKFRINVRTARNEVAEQYIVIISRPASNISKMRRLADILGYASTAVSSTRAYHFIHNAKFLQWLSLTNRVNGLPETYDLWTRYFHKFNLQFSTPLTHNLVRFTSTASSNNNEYSNGGYYKNRFKKVPLIAEPSDAIDPEILSSDSYVAPPSNYGILISKHQLPMALEWSDRTNNWVSILADSEVVRDLLGQLREQDMAAAALFGGHSSWSDRSSGSSGELGEVENPDYLKCAAGDDCTPMNRLIAEAAEEQQQRQQQRRRLFVLPREQRVALMEQLEVSYKNSEKVIDFTTSLVMTTGLLIVIGGVYLLLWTFWLHSSVDGMTSTRRDFPRILYPARFWLFVLDYGLISYTTCCAGLLFTPLQDASITVLGFETTPKQMAGLCGFLLVVLPISYVGIGCGLLALNSGTLVYTKTFQRYSDPRITSFKAFWRPLPWLPLVGRLFDIEITDVLEGQATDGEGNNLPALEDERRTNAPWQEYDNQRVFGAYKTPRAVPMGEGEGGGVDEPLLPTRGGGSLPANLKYYKALDAIKVGPPEYLGMNGNYEVSVRYPDAFISYCKQPIRNAYGELCEVNCEILLKHWAHLAASRQMTIIVPRENLTLVYADALSNLISKAQMGTLSYWAIDRILLLVMIILISFINKNDINGLKSLTLLAITALSIAAICTMKGVINSSLATWYAQMEADYRLEEKSHKYRNEEERRFSVWPFKDQRAKEHYLRLRQIKNNQKFSHPFYAIYGFIFEKYEEIKYHNFWKTRTAHAIYHFTTGPALTHSIKFIICLLLMIGGSRASSSATSLIAPTSNASTTQQNFTSITAFILSAIGLMFLNWESSKIFWSQLKVFAYESYIFTRSALILTIDLFRDVPSLIDRIQFYGHQTLKALTTQRDNVIVSFLYPKFQSESIRDINCREISVISNEIGVHMSGDCVKPKSVERKMFYENDPITTPRYGMQKTLFISGTIAVYRPELYRTMPIALPMSQFGASKHLQDRRVGCTIQIINHNTLRYQPRIRHDWRDDSYLTLFTNPKLVPPPGLIKKGLPGHGYVIKVDKVDQLVRIRGPGILPGRTYNIKLTFKPPPIDDTYTYEENSQESSGHLNGRWEAECICRDPGRLCVKVPAGCAPDLQEEILIINPEGHEERHDPARHHVVFDAATTGGERIMIIRTQYALLHGDDPYRVIWKIKPRGGLIHAVTNEPPSTRGEIRFLPNPGEEITDLDSAAWCVIRDTDKKITIDIDPRQTNAYEFMLSGIENDLPGSSGYLTQKLGVVLGEIDTIWGDQSVSAGHINGLLERIPCTLVQCVDPISRKWRVEPDFEEAVYRLSARKQEYLAMATQLRTENSALSDLWYRIITPAEYISFWKSRGLPDILDTHACYLDPLRDTHNAKVRPYLHLVSAAEPSLKQLLGQRLDRYMTAITRVQNEYKIWATAYKDLQLYEAQANLDALQQQGGYDDSTTALEDIHHAINIVRQLKAPYEQTLPNFVYPMIVQEKMISKASKWEAQFYQWERQLNKWLLKEEGAETQIRSHGDLSCYEFTQSQIMRLLKYVAYKPENLPRGRTQTALHYVVSSREVRGMNSVWRPDPLGSMLALIRVWGVDPMTGRPSPNLRRWEICFLKLTGTSIKVMLPSDTVENGLDNDDNNNQCDPWNRVIGWYVPLKCFEAIFCMEDTSQIPEEEYGCDFGDTMTGKLVFRRNTDAPIVHDTYVKRVHNDAFDNNFIPRNNEERRIMLGFTSDASNPDNLLPRELWYEQQQQGNDKLYTWPLTFRLWPSDLARWESVIRGCQMDKPPRDNADFDGTVPGYDENAGLPREPPITPPTQVSPPNLFDRDDALAVSDSSLSSEDSGFGKNVSDSDTNIIDADAVEGEQSELETPLPPRERPKDIVDDSPKKNEPLKPGELLGERQDWRFHGRNVEVNGAAAGSGGAAAVYEGDLHEGRRNGEGVLKFTDKDGKRWEYRGGFANDEPFGLGTLLLDDPDEIYRLRTSKDPNNKHVITGFHGTFSVPKEMTRGDTLPTASQPITDMLKIRNFFAASRQRDVVVGTDGHSDQYQQPEAHSAAQGPPRRYDGYMEDNKLGPLEPRTKQLVVDTVRSISACGHEGVLEATIANLDANYFRNRAIGDADLDEEDLGGGVGGSGRLADGRVREDDGEYLPHTGHWARVLDPSLGAQDFGQRLGDGEVQFADGTRFLKADERGLLNNRPNGKGHYYCPICPMNYFGDFRNGKPEGYGVMEFGAGENKVTYWGEFREGKRHGNGVMVAAGDKLYVEGHFEDDKLGGGFCRIDVHKDLRSKVNFNWFEGDFRNGQPNGRGSVGFFQDVAGKVSGGIIYRGEFKDGVRNGRGIVCDPDDKAILKGQWENDQAHGRADAYYLPNGMVYVGPMDRGDRCGLGKLFESVAGGLIYDGLWEHDVPHGRGTLYAPDGIYEGQMAQGLRDGKGIFIFNDVSSSTQRRSYEGSWKDDKPHGIGVYLAEDDEKYTVEFEEGRLKPRSLKPYRKGGPCGATPSFPEPSVRAVPELKSKTRPYQDKGSRLDTGLWVTIQNWGGDMWERHEEHPFEYRLAEGEMPEVPAKRSCPFERETAPPDPTDDQHVYRLRIRYAKSLINPHKTRKLRAAVRIQLLHHDIATKADEVGGADPIWNQTVILPFVKTKAIYFTVCDVGTGMTVADESRKTDKPIGTGMFNLEQWLASNPRDGEEDAHKVQLTGKDGEKAGELTFTVEKVVATEDMEVHRDQYDPACLRPYSAMPMFMKDTLFTAPTEH